MPLVPWDVPGEAVGRKGQLLLSAIEDGHYSLGSEVSELTFGNSVSRQITLRAAGRFWKASGQRHYERLDVFQLQRQIDVGEARASALQNLPAPPADRNPNARRALPGITYCWPKGD